MNRISEWEPEMEERIEISICERCDDLISFLYRELREHEVRDFERHLSACVLCRSQLASFREVRSDVVAWRDESLGMTLLSTRADQVRLQREKASALAAIRQFLNLSPLWLKGAVGFASILFLGMISLLLINLNAKPDAPLAGNDKVYSEAEMMSKVEAGIQDRLREPGPPDTRIVKDSPSQQVVVRNNKPRTRFASLTANNRRAPLTRSEKEQLAADLGLISAIEDPDLNLLGEQINR
jgi:hypothetical protein